MSLVYYPSQHRGDAGQKAQAEDMQPVRQAIKGTALDSRHERHIEPTEPAHPPIGGMEKTMYDAHVRINTAQHSAQA